MRYRKLGRSGLLVSELCLGTNMFGGAGLGWVELIAVMEELGRALAPVPFLSTAALATLAG